MAQPPLKTGKKADSADDFDETLLGVLNVVERDSQVSQRLISRELGVALGELRISAAPLAAVSITDSISLSVRW